MSYQTNKLYIQTEFLFWGFMQAQGLKYNLKKVRNGEQGGGGGGEELNMYVTHSLMTVCINKK